MKHFTIENDNNNIMVHGSVKEAEAVPDSERFGSEAALAKLAADWPAARLVEIWNSLPGAMPVKKFKDRATATSRIWKAIQSLGQAAGETKGALRMEVPIPEPDPEPGVPAEIAPDEAEAETVAGPEAGPLGTGPDTPETPQGDVHAPVAPQTPGVAPEAPPTKTKVAKAKKAPKPTTDASTPREGSKTSQVIAMLKREGGTTLEEIMAEMKWLKHTTRAMLSAGGSLTKKHGLVITSEKVGDKRVYSIKS